MTHASTPTPAELSGLTWRKASFSADTGGECVEAAPLVDGRVVVRNSKAPAAGTLVFDRSQLGAWLDGVRAGEYDDLA